MIKYTMGLPLLALLIAGCDEQPQTRELGLPDPAPIFRSNEIGRTDPKLTIVEFPETHTEMVARPIYQVGHMMVTTRLAQNRQMKNQAHAVKIYAADRELCALSWWGSLKERGFGWPFAPIEGDPEDLKMDAGSGVTSFTKPYITVDGQRAVFNYQLTPLSNSCVELTWNTGSESEASLWVTINDYRGKQITIGEQKFIENNFDDLQNQSTKAQPFTGGDMVYDLSDPINGFTLNMDQRSGHIHESVNVYDKGQRTAYSAAYRTTGKQGNTEGRLVINLGEVELMSQSVPPPVASVEFWKNDATHVPLAPTRNVMHNPSFEQGLRCWYWIGGGAQSTLPNIPKFEVVCAGKFGPSALRMNREQMGAPMLRSMPLALEKGQRYVVSFYAKSFLEKKNNMRLSLGNAARSGTISSLPWGDTDNPDSQFSITDEWQRYHRTFTADAAGVAVHLMGAGVLIDGIQLELGETPTEFTCDPLDINFVTSNPDNDLRPADTMAAGLNVVAQNGTQGMVDLEIQSAFREVLFKQRFAVSVISNNTAHLPLKLTTAQFGTGVFVVKTAISVADYPTYYDYYRFSIMEPLNNTHKTSRLMATLVDHSWRISRGEDFIRKIMACGWGGTSWLNLNEISQTNSVAVTLMRRYRFVNSQTPLFDEIWRVKKPEDLPWAKTWRELLNIQEITPEYVKYVEDASYDILKQVPKDLVPYVSYCNEEESCKYPASGRFDEYFQLQSAVGRAAKRLGIGCTPTSGTSGYNLLRGYEPFEGYLKAAHKQGFKYDALSVHPYGSIDKGTLSTSDLDSDIMRLIEQGERYGYGEETPILFTELFNIPETYVPEWGAGPSYDAYPSGKPTYDYGNREFIHAASVMRLYIICMKYWPRIQCANIWCSRPFIDLHLTPILLCKSVNTLGHLMGDIAYVADIRPAAGIRGYAFKLPDGTGIAPVWCTTADVENGLKKSPILAVKFGQPVEFIDFMGNRRHATPDREGYTQIPITPAPLFIKAKSVAKLTQALQTAEPDDCESSLAITFKPNGEGRITATLQNLIGREQRGVLEIGQQKISYTLPGNGVLDLLLPAGDRSGAAADMIHGWESSYRVVPESGQPFSGEWRMDYFFVTQCQGMPQWESLPALAITNRCFKQSAESVQPGDHEAIYKMGWDTQNLYLRVEVVDNKFITEPEIWENPKAERVLWNVDGALELYFDTGADGRANAAKTFDNNDYRYDFAPPRDGLSGAGLVWRFREVYHQLADGINMATKEEASQKIVCEFERTDSGYAVTITLAQRYLEPIVLKPGFVAGCGLYLHDHDAPKWQASKGLSTSTKAGVACDGHPELWPLMVLR